MPTTNPVPSTDPSDLIFNAGKLDEVVNGAANSFTDRLGVARRTVAGMNADFDAQLADAESDLNVYRADAAASAAEALGYLQTIRATSYGAYAEDPTTDPLGNPPTVGDEYFNTTANLLKRWNGTTWQASDINTANLAAPSGSSLVGYTQAGTGAVATTVQEKLRETVSVLDFYANGVSGVKVDPTGVVDSTAGIQAAIDYASSINAELLVPGGTYKLVPATTVTWEGGTCLTALVMRSNMHIYSNDKAVFRIANGVSSDAVPVHHQMFFTNQVLSNVTIRGLVMNMNGQNNPISPSRASKVFNRFMNAQICVSGTPGGVAARIDRCTVKRCVFQNNAGVSCIVAGQSNTVGAVFGTYWNILFNDFEEVGLDTDDHSSIYGRFTNSRIVGNRLVNLSPFSYATLTGGRCAIEMHGSNNVASINHIRNYDQGFWVTGNFTEPLVTNVIISNNTAYVGSVFVDFWSKNVLPYGENECPIDGVNIEGNTIELSDVASDVQVKNFFQLGARQQPTRVRFSGNTCRAYGANSVLALLLVRSDQRQRANQITISDNTCSGLVAGFVGYFYGSGSSATELNASRISFTDNDLGFLNASTVGIQSRDVYLYGPSAGKVEALYVKGLHHAESPILTDNHASGRARVYGKAILPSTVTWEGLTIGDGTTSKKVSIDSDSGFADVTAVVAAGSTTTVTGGVYPKVTGIVADANGTAAATHFKSGVATAVPAYIFDTANWITLLSATAGNFGPGEFTTGSKVAVSARFPCRYADV